MMVGDELETKKPGQDSKIYIPRVAAPVIALQRTAYQHPLARALRRLRLGRLYDKLGLPLIERARAGRIEELYQADILGEFQTLAPHLPDQATSLLDIGCGLGGIDVLLSRHYGHQARLRLLDKDGIGDIFYGYKAEGAHYNQLSLTRELLTMNGVPDQNIRTINISTDPFPANETFDLVLSLISWGFHYPVDTYLEPVAAGLRPGGRLILDIRRGTDGIARLNKYFTKPEIIFRDDKFDRVLAVKS